MANEPKVREWALPPQEDEEGILYPAPVEALDDELSKISGILERIGGVVMIATDRVQLEDGSYITAGYVFKWESFVPARRGQKVAQPQPGDFTAAQERLQAEADAQALADEINGDEREEGPVAPIMVDAESGDEVVLTPEQEAQFAHARAAEQRQQAASGVFGGAVSGPSESKRFGEGEAIDQAVAAVDEALGS